jgi:hypothetical protein
MSTGRAQSLLIPGGGSGAGPLLSTTYTPYAIPPSTIISSIGLSEFTTILLHD